VLLFDVGVTVKKDLVNTVSVKPTPF